MKKLTILTIALAILVLGCDKNNRASKRLMRPGNWIVTQLTIDGSNYNNETGYWSINNCNIEAALCTGAWHLAEKNSQFYWQFNENAEVFTISRIVAPEDCEDFYTEEVEQMTYNLSGAYEVVESKRKSKIFQSRNTIGFEGKLVRIELEWK